jgi:hypothetical protein
MASSLPTREAHQRVVLKPLYPSQRSIAVSPRRNGTKTLQLACWNADISTAGSWNWNSSSVCTAWILASWTRCTLMRASTYALQTMFATGRIARHGKEAQRHLPARACIIMLCQSGLPHLVATTTYRVLATRPVKLVAAYLPPTRPFMESDPTECLGGRFPS